MAEDKPVLIDPFGGPDDDEDPDLHPDPSADAAPWSDYADEDDEDDQDDEDVAEPGDTGGHIGRDQGGLEDGSMANAPRRPAQQE